MSRMERRNDFGARHFWMRSIQRRGSFSCCIGVSFSLLTFGCATNTKVNPDGNPAQGHFFYLDGAGGGNLIANWGRGVNSGFQKAGYTGTGEQFKWQTGLGVAADQVASDEYKRKKAAELAAKVQEFAQTHPGAPITLIGLSAGTAIAVFTLEELPEGSQIENAVLLSGSLSSNYDLTKALQRVRNRMYVFTSDKDGVLKFLLPFTGTADRGSGEVQSAGLQGFSPPMPASAETKRQYAKLVHIQWSPEFKAEGDRGGHTDTVNSKFVQAYVAPLVMKTTPITRHTERGSVANPDFRRWNNFGVGSSLTLEGYQVVEGRKSPLRVTGRLAHKWDDKLFLERTFEPIDRSAGGAPWVRGYFEWARIDPSTNPLTSPKTRTSELQPKTFQVQKGRTLVCSGRTGTCDAQFVDWGKNPTATVYSNEEVPGGVVDVQIKAIVDGREVEYYESLVDFERVGAANN